MDITCSAEPCPIVLSATCVFYEGNNLIYTGINNNDNLEIALQKIDQKFQDAGLGYIFSNGIEQLTPGGAVMLGGALTKNTTIGGLYRLAFAGTLEASALVTTGGTSSQFVKGDGSLDPTSYQPSGNYITNLTGDVTANGPGSVTATLATVFGAPGTYGNSGSVPSITVDGKGRITNVTPIPINYPAQSLSFVGDVEGLGFTGSPVTLTLDTVNTDIYGSNNFLKFAVNGKGLITSATPVSDGDIATALGYVPVDNAIELTINGVAHDLTANRDWEVGTVTTVGVVAGLGISASVSNPSTTPVINIVNTAPDQTVRLNAGFGISISGSYPNFTITNDYPDLPEKVTSFSSGNLPPLFTTSVATPTTTPALSFALANAAGNTVFAGPNGGAGAPTYRALVAADIPSLSYISNISVSAPLATTGGLTPTISISQANASTDGYLSSTDWNTFNNKEDALGFTPVPNTRQLDINGVTYDLTADRCWSVGTVTSITASAPLTGGTITGSGSVGITQAGAGSDGYLSSADWNTFDGKQPAGNYITDLTGDATASGPGSACLTLATVNASTGTFGSSTQVPVITVNNKGLVTCVTTDTISGSLEFIGDVTGIGSTGTCTSLTLATVNNDVYTSETLLNIAVNGKGLITSANPTTAGNICSTLGYTPEDVANKSTSTALGTSNTLYPTQLAVKTYVDSATAGGIILQGNWNAATNTPNISGTTTTGWAWRVDVAGTTNLGGITDWQVGDLAVKSATGWVKIDNTENVTSVFGRFGAIVATAGDYLTCQVTECGNLYYTDARVRAAVGHTAPLTYCSTTGVFGITQSNATTDGYLSSVDWNTFNDKQPLIAAGTISQYYRGDKTFQNLDTSVVTEGTNFYFTDGRARAAICASSGVAYNPSTGLITNSCPDQIVSLTGGGTTSIAGTYPNFCITSSDSFTGTVTCVAVSGTNIGVTGSPITSAGTIGLSLSGANVCNALGYTPYNATNPAGYTTCTGTVTSVATSTSTTGVLLSGSPITSSGTLGINISTASTVCTGLLTAADWNTFNSHTSCTGTVTSVGLTSSTTGVSIGGSPITSSGNLSLNIATASSICTGLLTAADWNSFNSRTSCTGTVTCVAATGTNISVTGSPITTSGTLAISLSGANVCAALGYTPYNATNPNGYTTCIGTVTSVGVVATNINVCNSPVTTSGNICLNLTAANVCSALGYSPVQPNGTGATGTWGINVTGTSSRFASGQSNWVGTGIIDSVIGLMAWKNYGNSHVIFDASQGTSPSGGGVSQRNSTVGWTESYPTLMGWNGSTTYGVRVDSSRISDNTSGNSATTSQRDFSGDISTSGMGRFTGWYNGNAATGLAAEIGISAGQAYIIAYNRQTSSYGTLNLESSAATLRLSGSTVNVVSGALQQGGNQVLHAGNFNSYSPTLTGGGASGTWGINITGNAGNASTVSGITPSQIFNNMGNTHGTYTDFNSVGNFGVRYLQGATNGPGTGSSQYYGFTLGLGNEYPYSGAGSYGSQFYWNRTATGGNPYVSVRFNEGGSWGSWSKIYAGYADSAGSVDFNNLTNKTGGTGTYQTSGDFRAPIFYDSDNTAYYLDPNSTGTSLNIAGSVNAATFNKPGLLVNSSGTGSAGSSIAIQQVTGEGWTGIFVDFEPFTGWGLYHDNPSNYFLITSESATGAVGGGFTVPSRSSGNRTAYVKHRFDQNNGEMVIGGRLTSPAWTTTGRNYSNEWLEFPNFSGLYSPLNGAHFYPNNGTYGSWRVAGSRNGWGGFEFDASNGQVVLMVNPSSNTTGFHNNSYGWQFLWEGGVLYVHKNAYGGGTRATVIDSTTIGVQSVAYANNAGNTSSISSAVGGNYTWIGLQYFRTNLGGYCGSLSNAPLQAYSDSNNSAFFSFHKGGHYAVNMGLDADNVLRIGGWSAAANRWQLDMSGNMTVAGDVTAYSDARVKTNIKTIENALDKVLGLRGVSYNRTDSDDKKTKIGVIAQETLPIVPEVVNQDNDGMYNVSYGNFGGLFIEAFKEQQKQIEHLKSIIDALTK